MNLCYNFAIAIIQLQIIGHLVNAHYMNQWAIEIDNGSQLKANKIAKDTGCKNKGPIIDNVFLIECNHVEKRSIGPHHDFHTKLSSHQLVNSAEQQIMLTRKKRLTLFTQSNSPENTRRVINKVNNVDLAELNDNKWHEMWYLRREGNLDMNVQEVWKEGITGKGVSVTIVDDGVEKSHQDLVQNYDPRASYDVVNDDMDPSPAYNFFDSNRHGTRCAGEVAATANNSHCAVGVAYDAGIGGIRLLGGLINDAKEAKSLGFNNQHIDIYTSSWGPNDDGKTVEGPRKLATQALRQGITKGRNGKGNIFVWASGNGGRDHDNCNCDGYTGSPWTISISAASENGLAPWYSEKCSGTLATAYSSGSSEEGQVVTTDLHDRCTTSHTGTSAAAPLAAGIIALVLQANPELTWRDVQHLTVRCAHNANLKSTDWSQNAAGREYSHSFGYGLMDALCMVNLAKKWTSVPEQRNFTTEIIKDNLALKKENSTIDVDSSEGLKYIEHIQVYVTLETVKRGDIEIWLISPKGTRSNLLSKRPKDYSRDGFNNWPFLTVHMWEESPIGTWTLQVTNRGIYGNVKLKKWSIVFLGTETHPQPSLRATKKG